MDLAACDITYHNRDLGYGETETLNYETNQETDNLSWQNRTT